MSNKFKDYDLLNPLVFFVDHHAYKYLVNKLHPNRHLARWVLLLEEFDYIVKYKPHRMHKQTDHLSHNFDKLGTEYKPSNENVCCQSATPKWYSHNIKFLSTQKKYPQNSAKVRNESERTTNTLR